MMVNDNTMYIIVSLVVLANVLVLASASQVCGINADCEEGYCYMGLCGECRPGEPQADNGCWSPDDDDIESELPVCHPLSRKCVECWVDGDCESGDYCDPYAKCVKQCTVDDECNNAGDDDDNEDDAMYCNTGTSKCETCLDSIPDNEYYIEHGIAAYADTGCDLSLPICSAGAHGSSYQCVECEDHAHCGPSHYCYGNRCVECGGDDNECQSQLLRPICAFDILTCVECLQNTDCLEYPYTCNNRVCDLL